MTLLLSPALLSAGSVDNEPDRAREPELKAMELGYGFRITLVGTPHQILKMKRGIDRIARVPKGNETLW